MRKLLILLFIPILFISFSIGSSGVTAQADTLPLITYLGEGPGTFTIQAPLLFIVKTYQDNQFLFITAEPPAYEAVARERVWSTNFLPAESIRLFGEWHSYGQVAAGCLVEYVQIDDNVDDRRNIFYLNGTPLHTVAQGMVTYGRFSIPEDGELTFYAADSIGMILLPCSTPQTATFTLTPSATLTLTQEEQSTNTPTPTQTITLPPPATATLTPTHTASPSPTRTATPILPTATIEKFGFTLTPTRPSAQEELPTPTQTTLASAATQTQIPTPALIPVTGEGPGPREIAAQSLLLLAALALTAAGWWFLLRWRRNEHE